MGSTTSSGTQSVGPIRNSSAFVFRGNGDNNNQDPQKDSNGNNKQPPPHSRTDKIRALITKNDIQGIPNLGQTCAMNSIIQFLLCIPGYESLLYQTYDELTTTQSQIDLTKKEFCLSLMDVLCFMRGGCDRVRVNSNNIDTRNNELQKYIFDMMMLYDLLLKLKNIPDKKKYFFIDRKFQKEMKSSGDILNEIFNSSIPQNFELHLKTRIYTEPVQGPPYYAIDDWSSLIVDMNMILQETIFTEDQKTVPPFLVVTLMRQFQQKQNNFTTVNAQLNKYADNINLCQRKSKESFECNRIEYYCEAIIVQRSSHYWLIRKSFPSWISINDQYISQIDSGILNGMLQYGEYGLYLPCK